MRSSQPDDYSLRSTEELVDLLCTYGAGVPLELAREIVARGAEAVPALCEIVSDEAWWHDEDSAVAVHALHLLGAIGDPLATAALLAPLERDEESDFMTESMPGVLARLGPQAIPELRPFVDDPGQDEVMRSVVYEGLVGMSLLHPELQEQVKLIGRELATRCLLKKEPLPPLIGVDLVEYQDPADLELLERVYRAGLWKERAYPWAEVEEAFREGRSADDAEHLTHDPMGYFAAEEQARLAEVWGEWRRR